MSELDDLLDMELDDLQDLPTFDPFPEGAHRILLTLEAKEVNKKPAIELTMKIVETLELANPTEDEAPEVGAETNILYFLDNEFGQGNLKLITPILGKVFGTRNIREIVEQTTDLECLVLTTQRKNKETGQVYTQLKELKVA